MPYIRLIFTILVGLSGCSEPDTPAVEAQGWDKVLLNTQAQFNDVAFTDDNNGWLAGGAHNTAGGLLGKTTDGGLTWTLAGNIADTNSTSLTAVHFFNEQLGLVGTDRGEILKTTDGGVTWRSKLNLQGRFGDQLSKFTFPKYGIGYATARGRLLRTRDFGDSWQCFSSASKLCPAVATCDQAKAPSKFDLSAVAFRSDRLVTAISGRHALAISTDGGCTWQIDSRFTQQTPVRLTDIEFTNAERGWVVGEQGFVATTQNGGETWQLQNPKLGANMHDVLFIDGNTGYLVGQRVNRSASVILTTTNAGADWDKAYEVENDLLHSLHVNLNGSLWAAGEALDISQGQHLVRYVKQ